MFVLCFLFLYMSFLSFFFLFMFFLYSLLKYKNEERKKIQCRFNKRPKYPINWHILIDGIFWSFTKFSFNFFHCLFHLFSLFLFRCFLFLFFFFVFFESDRYERSFFLVCWNFGIKWSEFGVGISLGFQKNNSLFFFSNFVFFNGTSYWE